MIKNLLGIYPIKYIINLFGYIISIFIAYKKGSDNANKKHQLKELQDKNKDLENKIKKHEETIEINRRIKNSDNISDAKLNSELSEWIRD